MKYEHVIEASQDAKQMEDASILGGDPLDGRPCETCQYYTLGCGEDCREGDGHDSDCSTHNAPAYPAGDCDCSASLIKRLRKISADNKGPRDCIDEAADEIEKRNRNRNAVIEECAGICDRFQARDVGMQPAECAAAIRALKSQPAHESRHCEYNGGTCTREGCKHGCQAEQLRKSQPAAPDKRDEIIRRQAEALRLAKSAIEGAYDYVEEAIQRYVAEYGEAFRPARLKYIRDRKVDCYKALAAIEDALKGGV